MPNPVPFDALNDTAQVFTTALPGVVLVIVLLLVVGGILLLLIRGREHSNFGGGRLR